MCTVSLVVLEFIISVLPWNDKNVNKEFAMKASVQTAFVVIGIINWPSYFCHISYIMYELMVWYV